MMDGTDVWTKANPTESMEVWNTDEYGDRSYMWDYL